jgi:hypothetical protein
VAFAVPAPQPPAADFHYVLVRETPEPTYDLILEHGDPSPTPSLIAVRESPPAPRVEVQPPRPTPRHVWIAGHWRFYGHHYTWIDGQWRVPPRRGAVWVAPHWDRHPDGHVFVEGYWRT